MSHTVNEDWTNRLEVSGSAQVECFYHDVMDRQTRKRMWKTTEWWKVSTRPYGHVCEYMMWKISMNTVN